jgi:hypothetical protein
MDLQPRTASFGVVAGGDGSAVGEDDLQYYGQAQTAAGAVG